MRFAFVRPAASRGAAAEPDYCACLAAALGGLGHDAGMVAPDTWRGLDAATRIVVDVAAMDGMEIDVLAARRGVAVLRDVVILGGGYAGVEAPATSMPALALGAFERVVATSEAAAALLRARADIAPDAIVLVTPGTADAPRSLGSGGPGCTILSVAFAASGAPDDLLLRALARLFDLDWRLVVLGPDAPDGASAATHMALADELGIAGRIDFARVGSPEDVAALWARSDLFALGAPRDGYGTAVAEALRRGVPVAMVGGDDVSSMVAPDAGAVCSPGDRDTLSKSLRRMIFDTGLRREMADAAWRIGRDLPDWPTQARVFVTAIGAAIES